MSVTIKKPSKDDLDPNFLRQAARGRVGAFPATRAMALLPKTEPQSARRELLDRANDRRLDGRKRRVAVAALARVDDPVVIPDLEGFARARPDVSIPAIKALGLRGGQGSLGVLATNIRDRRAPRAVRQASKFAAALIAHRLDVDGYDLSKPSAHPYLQLGRDAQRDMKFSVAPGQEQLRLRETLREDAPGVQPGARGWAIECRDRISMLIFDAATAEGWDAKAFAKRRFYVGQIALRNPTTGSYAPGLTILSSPDGEGQLEIGLYRGSGTLTAGGTGKIVGNQIEMLLRSADRIGAFPMELRLRASPNDVDLLSGRVGRRVSRRAHPSPAKTIHR